MKKCIVIPDSFKGTLSAVQVCSIMEKKINKIFPQCQVIAIPAADGGEGTVDSFLYALKGQKVIAQTKGPFGENIKACYGRFHDLAVIEMAAAAGLMLAEGKLNPCKATTYGVGLLVRHAILNGAKRIILGLGGSCTNDGGTGMARALGTKFYTEEGKEFEPEPDNLTLIDYINNDEPAKLLKNCKITAMCDISNPLYGKNGAAYIYAPQKGADEKMAKKLDLNLEALSDAILRSFGKDISNIPGAGAAGGMGAGTIAFLGGRLQSGIDTILDITGFNEELKDTDLIFTGEGCLDKQSLNGKVVIGVARRAERFHMPVIAVTGSIGTGAKEAYNSGVTAIFDITQKPCSYSEIKEHSEEALGDTMEAILRLWKCSAGYRNRNT